MVVLSQPQVLLIRAPACFLQLPVSEKLLHLLLRGRQDLDVPWV